MENYHSLLLKQKDYFAANKTKDVSFRLHQLKKLKKAIQNYEAELIKALKTDLNKSKTEAYMTEIGIIYEEINFVVKHLKDWAKPKTVKTPITHVGSKSKIYPEPYGSVLVIAPWNYPFQLAVAPLIGAMAAGNCAVMKPSELTPETSRVLSRLVQDTFDEEYISVVEGAVETSQALLKEDFDKIFFTGSTAVGKIIMEAAAKTLTPVTLELGGKSPCIVHKDANLELAAKRIVWGKFLNAGQTCVAPDYLLVHHEMKESLLEQMKITIREFYGENALQNENFTHIVSERHFDRLSNFLSDGNLVVGGKTERSSLIIEPTILDNISWDDPVMEDEIFGPILPVLTYKNVGDAIEQVNSRPKPLALYVFSEEEEIQQTVIDHISFGGGCINDTVYHLSSPYLPFGGVGASGMGAYHGKGSFDVFSHEKSILKQTTRFDIPLRYPNTKNALKKLKLIFK
ncbi:aldehyde dehydrogenase [Pseudalkalibacillus caeni]|uniref:Aldehyde dehydrogenase n=1 Tax=Exobacillus caeni TaxID=2574798 RepID=A0A5R9F5N9_9BACL|nr:aldehyde dehydrogenase [Pseudalkalibacillus caeni]TLS36133.1 aldehyde dehydrogenase [Pseudalkalibacillus caeni]